jgi:hypothetical protein
MLVSNLRGDDPAGIRALPFHCHDALSQHYPPLLEMSRFYLPDLITLCAAHSSVNPFHSTIGAEATAWVSSFQIFTGSKRTLFSETKMELLVARACPSVGRDEYRMCCDLSNLLVRATIHNAT